MDAQLFEKVKQGIKEFEQALGVQEGFYKRLLDSDSDWLFVIRLHAFLEAVCTVLISKALGKTELTDVISRANIYTKTQYIEKLNLLSKNAVKFIRELSEIRNIYVHNINSVALSLEEYLKQRTPDQRNRFAKVFGYDTVEEITVEGITVKRRDLILKNPRFAIYLGTFSVLSEVVAQWEMEKVKLDEAALSRREAELYKKTAEILWGLTNNYLSAEKRTR